MWRARRRPKEVVVLLNDCEAVLSGRFVEHLELEGRSVPAWAWLNMLTHGSTEHLRAQRPSAAVCERWLDWRQARAFLAHEIVETAQHHSVSVGAIQREVLLPLELSLTSSNDAPATPAQLVGLVHEALESWRRVHRDL